MAEVPCIVTQRTSNVDRYFKGIKTESAIKALHENIPVEDLEDLGRVPGDPADSRWRTPGSRRRRKE